MEEGTEAALMRRLAEIERRLVQLEEQLGLPKPERAVPLIPSNIAEPEIPMATIAPPVRAHAAPPPLPGIDPKPVVESPEKVAAQLANDRYAANMRAAYDGGPPVGVPTPPRAPRPQPPKLPRDPATLEQTIGLKWAGWVGAIVLVIGAGLGFKYAYDQGWLGGLPPAAKLLIMTLIGFGLIGLGEVVYRRINRMSAAGLYGAGVAVLFLCGYASHAWYGLFDPTAAVVLMGGAAFVGVLIAARSDLVSVAVLAIVGGSLAPLILGGNAPLAFRFLCYLACLQLMALGLCALRKEPKWWSLRGVAFASTAVWVFAILGSNDAAAGSMMLLTFCIGFWATFQIELLTTLPRAALGRLSVTQRSAGVGFSLLNVMALALWILAIYDHQSERIKGEWLIGIAAVVGIMGFTLARVREGILAPLARGYRVQAVLLLILAVPVLLHGPNAIFGWMLLGIGLSLHGLRNRDRLALFGAIGVWALAVLVWMGWADDDQAARNVWCALFGQAFEARLCVAGALMVAGHVIATTLHLFARTRRPVKSRAGGFGYMIDLAAAIVWGAALLNFARPEFAMWSLIAYAWALFVLSFLSLLTHLGIVGLIVLSTTALKWVVIDVLTPRFSPGWRPLPGALFWNRQAAMGYVLAGSLGAMSWFAGRRRINPADADAQSRTDSVLAVAFTVGLVFLGFVLSLEIDAMQTNAWDVSTAVLYRNLLLTILWSCGVVAWLLTLRPAIRTPAIRLTIHRVALGLALILGVIFIVFDVAGSYADSGHPLMRIGLNLQVLTAFIVGSHVCLTAVLAPDSRWRGMAVFMVPALLWVTGTAEIDRYAVIQNHGPTWIVRQVGWSIYWSLLAVVLLIVGFAGRLNGLRYLALALLATTLLKVTLVDLAGAGTGWRILSFLGLGVLLLATSVLYGRFGKPPAPHATKNAD